jgi:hypothetical protein
MAPWRKFHIDERLKTKEELNLRRGHFHTDESRPVLNSRSYEDYNSPIAWLRNE